MNKSNKFSPEMRERAVRMVQEHRGDYPSLCATVESIAPKIGCVPQTLLEWVKRVEIDSGSRPGTTSAEAQRIKELERENRELRRANDILRTASAFCAQAELDRKLKSSVLKNPVSRRRPEAAVVARLVERQGQQHYSFITLQ